MYDNNYLISLSQPAGNAKCSINSLKSLKKYSGDGKTNNFKCDRTRGLHGPKFYGPARCTLIGAVASAAGTGHVINLLFWLNGDAPCGVVDNRTLMFSLWLQLESVHSFVCYILSGPCRPLFRAKQNRLHQPASDDRFKTMHFALKQC